MNYIKYIKNMKKNILIIIILIIAITILAVLWLNNNNREGLAFTEQDAADFGNDLQSYASDRLAKHGIIIPKDISTNATKFISDLSALMKPDLTQPSTASSYNAGAKMDIDTTLSPCNKLKSFFFGNNFSDSFCQINGNSADLNSKCSELTADSCNQTSCCIFINGNKCVAGDADGPTILTENGKDIDYSYYSYKNKCYGSCGEGQTSANPCTAFNDTDTNLSTACLKHLWKASSCPNKKYVTDEVTTSFKDYNKEAIRTKFILHGKEEPNYANCYGPDESKWPVPCDGTTDTTVGLSARCLKKLFTDSGCINTDYITTDLVTANALEPKSAMVSQFGIVKSGTDNDSYTKCYGSDKSKWPDPCAIYNDDSTGISKSCMQKMVNDSMGDCPNVINIPDKEVDYLKIFTKKTIFDNIKNKFGSLYTSAYNNANLTGCYGTDKTKWPRTEHLLGVGTDGKLYTKPTSDLTSPWTKHNTESCCVEASIQLHDGTFLAVGTDGNLHTKKTLEDGWARVPNSARPVDIVEMTQLNNSIVCTGTDGALYYKKTLTDNWIYVPNSQWIFSISLLKDKKTLAGLSREFEIWTRNVDSLGSLWVSYWRPAGSKGQIKSVVQLNDNSIVAVGMNNMLFTTSSLSGDWTMINSSDGITVLRISVIYI